MKKQLLLGALCLLTAGVFGQAQWISQATTFTPVSSGVRYISVVDTNVVWICSYDGSGGQANRQDFARTEDGGATWISGTVPAPTNYDWAMIHGIDNLTAYAVLYNSVAAGDGGGVWMTTDGGVTWTQQGQGQIYVNAASFPNVVYFWDANNGFLQGDPIAGEYELYTTTDGGATWVQVDTANIPAPLNASEYGIVGHFSVIGDTIWWDTNNGRVYRSTDRGYTWTVAATGITVPANEAFDICFYSATNGIARHYNQTTGVNTAIKETTDGGDTWQDLTITGTLFGSDLKAVPGTQSMLVSTGAATPNIGSSYSLDGGHTWTTMETLAQRTALGIADSLTMWAGGFTSSPMADGIFRWMELPVISCTDAAISPGTPSANVTQICPGDTVTVTSSGVVAPTVGNFFGVSWIISNADISGSLDPLQEPSLIATYGLSSPAPVNSTRQLINDSTLVGQAGVPFGSYFWTPVVYGNATDATGTGTPTFLADLNLDQNCTFTGTSVMVDVLSGVHVDCGGVSVAEMNKEHLAIFASLQGDMINLRVNSTSYGKTNVEVYDLTGRKVATTSFYVTKGVNQESISAGTLGAGTYVIMAETNGVRAVNKLVVL